jgi:ABC-type dipeptide/oligopeptide/nickel transport system permease subunit
MSVTTLPSLVILEACLAYLGLGVPRSWGTMIADGLRQDGSLWSAGWAMAALLLTVAATQVLAEEVALALSPRTPQAATAQGGSRAS